MQRESENIGARFKGIRKGGIVVTLNFAGMKTLLIAGLIALSAITHVSIARADNFVAYPNSLVLTDGTVATPTEQCSVSDLCVKVKEANGDVLSFYNKGAQKCDPYKVHAIRMQGGTKLFEYDIQLQHSKNIGMYHNRQCQYESTGEVVVDGGHLHIGFYQNHMGNLFTHVWATDAKIVPSPAASP